MKTRFYVSALMLLSLAIMSPAIAADNSKLPVCNTGTCGGTAVETFANKDVAGIKFPKNILHDTLGNALGMPTAGADALTNSTLGLATYNLPMVFNGTTWDRWRGDTTNGAWVNIKSSVAIAVTQSGTWTVQPGNTANTTPWLMSVNDGTNTAKVQAASTAAAAADKSLVTNESPNSQLSTAVGATGDAAASIGGTGSVSAKLRQISTQLDTLNTTAGGAVPAGTNTIGNVGSDPSSGKGTPASVAINVSTATTTQLVAISGSTKIYVTSFDVIAGGTGNITFVYGTGSSCGTGTTSLTGAYNLTAQVGIAKGNGLGAVLVVPAGNALCVTTSAAVQMSGSVSYQQF